MKLFFISMYQINNIYRLIFQTFRESQSIYVYQFCLRSMSQHSQVYQARLQVVAKRGCWNSGISHLPIRKKDLGERGQFWQPQWRSEIQRIHSASLQQVSCSSWSNHCANLQELFYTYLVIEVFSLNFQAIFPYFEWFWRVASAPQFDQFRNFLLEFLTIERRFERRSMNLYR